MSLTSASSRERESRSVDLSLNFKLVVIFSLNVRLCKKKTCYLYIMNCMGDNVSQCIELSYWCHPQRWMGTETLNHSAQCVCKHGAQFSWVAVDGVNLRPPVQVRLAGTWTWNINHQWTVKWKQLKHTSVVRRCCSHWMRFHCESFNKAL